MEEEIKQVKHDIANIIPYTIAYYKRIKTKYGKVGNRPDLFPGSGYIGKYVEGSYTAVSYTHLDVSKRQCLYSITSTM